MRKERVRAALAVCGKYRDPFDETRVAQEHDRYLEKIYDRERLRRHFRPVCVNDHHGRFASFQSTFVVLIVSLSHRELPSIFR